MDCENCKHRVMKVEVGKGTPPEHFWGCECWECEFEPTTKNNLGVDREDAVERLNALKQLIGYDKDSEIVKATQKSLDMAIKALEQEPISETDIILTREEYGELVSSEYDNGYAKGYREALEQEPTTKNNLGMFVPVILTDEKGNKRNAFLYKPQRLIVTSYITEELAKNLGYKIEVEDGNVN